jgi:hypothetical protein
MSLEFFDFFNLGLKTLKYLRRASHMDKITNTKTEFRIRQWTQIAQACQSSGMTVVAWCNQNNINIKSYYYWLRRLRALACESTELTVVPHKQQVVPLSFKQPRISDHAAITIHISSATVEIHDGTSKDTIEAVLLALKNIC